ncbi:TIGR01457 family HAD-type hydrolase [Lysinibacillus sp. 2017]|uniref:TIGR01457 family HAD-type hydrolase n=1 Tax=unclassified Lysinibacillus TaxID=2636778 RepID=UPI000D526629|nr:MULTISPECIES: TIGR01457 family HAD-type hydrolase [unclassified Lysinibacillus]AWE08447.1 TIGR01457 family HAD-type hydrolase [Lysinibacillus sp. 2017]TGN34935.1 TIGR01457 family HAD-type hydrolase [Lysinibacillus sp. S2017]
MSFYKAYCFDLDGTIYRGKAGIESAVQFVHYLQAQKIEPFYLTNNSSKTREMLQQSLRDIGINAPLEHIYSSALATAKYVAKICTDKKVNVVGEQGIRTALEQEGLEITDEQSAVLVMGIDRQITYDKLVKASFYVQNGAELIGTNGDIKFPSERSFAPGNGSFVHLVANVAGVTPTFIGKPSPVMLQIVADEHHFTKEQMVMVGDNYDTDILCGINFGCDTIHVNTGVTPTDRVKQQSKLPTYCVENLLELIK